MQGETIDFQTRIHRDIMARVRKILCGKTIAVLLHEVYGDPRWHSGGWNRGKAGYLIWRGLASTA